LNIQIHLHNTSATEIINLVSEGIDKTLGDGSAPLLFQIMRTIRKMNQDGVVHKPVVFEATLKLLFGNNQ